MIFALLTGLWGVQLFTRNAAVADLGWTAAVALLHLSWAWQSGQGWGLALMVSAWALRLSVHLWRDRIWQRPEEGRYVKLRREWGQGGLLLFFQAQAVAALVLAWPYRGFYLQGQAWTPGALVFLVGLAGVATADRQLARFKATGDRGVCEVGLWRYSRHPNYFFELLLWLGWSLYAGGGWALVSPLLLLYLVLFVTGIPPTEEQALRSRGEAYRRYQQTTSPLVPWFRS